MINYTAQPLEVSALLTQAVRDAHSVLSNDSLRRKYDEEGYAALGPQYSKYAFAGSSQRLASGVFRDYDLGHQNECMCNHITSYLGKNVYVSKVTY